MASEYGPATFGDGEFYVTRVQLRNQDSRDNSLQETTQGQYWLRMLSRSVTLGSVAMAERDIHAGAMRSHAKAIDLLGPKAIAGREDATAHVLLNSLTGRQEPVVLQHINDRLACNQEITMGIVIRDPNEVELIRLLQERGLTEEDRYMDGE